jgi:hypothetical protein
MPNQLETTKEQTYTIHTVAGQQLTAKGVKVSIDPKQNRVYFLDADGNDKAEGIYILSGIVAIKPASASKVSFGRLRM